ncbi:MAG: exodeoxyribonuclease VII small subunit [Bacteroidales bacterium]
MEGINSYSEAITALEKIVEKLQGDNCKIDDLKLYTKQSVELLNYCKEQLFQTDEELKKLLDGLSDK